MKKAFKTEIMLSPAQKQKVNQTIGTCRYVYNLYIKTAQSFYKETGKYLSGYDFSKWLNNVYTKEKDAWIKDVSSKAVKQAIMNGDRAFKNFFKGLANFPRFKKKKDQYVKAYFPKNNPTDLIVERHRIKVPTIGWVRFKEYGYIPTNLNVISCRISQCANRYYISVLFEVKQSTKSLMRYEGIGVDLGIKNLAVCSHNKVFLNINKTLKFKKIEKQLKRQQRKLSRRDEQNKKQKGGEFCTKNRQKQVIRLQKLHARLTNIRIEYIRYVVNELVRAKPAYITIEDLNTKGMMKNRYLAKSIKEQCFGYFKKWLIDKCNEYGIELRQVSRFYPSSKLCSNCGIKKVKLSLSERIFRCDHCQSEIERDFNASLNLKYATKYKVLTKVT
ncbi:RNA-guided endonuclease InsQ/TnpB family protein [Caryophanon latum]|uniref:Transposase n=1 Tax=Caryophanon latum TaxID=33977 RepID=A0A1C0Z2D3_9BACL|nr:RNA-guided endonuclease TnpB family protein [Caryophanon latum]OCS93609.1 transposase [Caryophanon latum]